MKIASIDVGIKNLAMCIFDISNNVFTIDSWNVINLANEEKCCQCNENAKFTKNNIYYCQKHAKKTEFKIPPINLLTIEKKTKKDLVIMCNDNKIELPIGTSLKTDIISIVKSKYRKDYFTQVERIKAHAINLVDIGTALKNSMESIDSIDVDKVIIENQIGPIANRMKCLQAMITQFFIDNGISDIEYISAANKLSAFMSGPSEYKDRKKHSVTITRSLIKNEKWLEFFNKHKKKDDLGDCFLQGIWYLQKNNLIVNCGDT
tara:strand:+ start:7731 stop:8516 length:786 start_codon:yes stop_codon:yes gene_type:complete